MENQLQVSNNNELAVIDQREVLGKDFKIYGDIENPLFLAKDIAEMIENKNTSQMLKSIDEEEKVKEITPIYNIYNGQYENQDCLFITEDGLYEVLMQSRKQIAKEFKKEVKKILKTIRRTGGYIATNENDDAETIMAKALIVAQETIKSKNKILKQKEIEIKKLEPRASYTDLILQSKALVNVTQIAQDYGMSAVAFNHLLNANKIQFQQNNQWILYAKYKDKGYVGSETFKFKHKTTGKKDVTMTTKWTQKGRKFLYDFLKGKGIIPVMEMEG